MRRIVGVVGLGVALCACGGAKPPEAGAPEDTGEPAAGAQGSAAPVASAVTTAGPAAPKVDVLERQKAYAKEADAAWAAHDAKKFIALYAATAVFAEPGPAGWTEKKGADMERELRALFTAFPDAKLTTTRLLIAGPNAVAEWTLTGTNKGEFMGEKATDKPVGLQGASLLAFDEQGKVAQEHLYLDHATLRGQLGKGPKGQRVRPVAKAPSTPVEIVVAAKGEPGANVGLVKRFYEASEKQDKPTIKELLAGPFVLSNSYDPADQGKAQMLEQMPIMSRAFTEPKWAVKQCLNAGAFAACEIAWTATWKGPAMGMKPTGKKGTVHALEVAQVKDGKLVRLNGYGSGAEFAYAFGLMDQAGKDKPKDTSKDKPKDKPKGKP